MDAGSDRLSSSPLPKHPHFSSGPRGLPDGLPASAHPTRVPPPTSPRAPGPVTPAQNLQGLPIPHGTECKANGAPPHCLLFSRLIMLLRSTIPDLELEPDNCDLLQGFCMRSSLSPQTISSQIPMWPPPSLLPPPPRSFSHPLHPALSVPVVTADPHLLQVPELPPATHPTFHGPHEAASYHALLQARKPRPGAVRCLRRVLHPLGTGLQCLCGGPPNAPHFSPNHILFQFTRDCLPPGGAQPALFWAVALGAVLGHSRYSLDVC